MLAQAQIPFRLSIEQILAAILLLSSEEQEILRQSAAPILTNSIENNSTIQNGNGKSDTTILTQTSNFRQGIVEDEYQHSQNSTMNQSDPLYVENSQPRLGVYYRGGIQVDDKSSSEGAGGTDSWRELLDNIEDLAVDTGIEDLSINLDHYLYGHPKQAIL